ncbi:MAG: hypothetical protein Kow0069_17310 [Promethearchaeota archaeon]
MLSEKVLVVTGASGGIGSCLVGAFHGEVAGMVAASRRPLPPTPGLEAASASGEFLHVRGDLAEEDGVVALFDAARERFGRVDALLNCVGGSLYSHPLAEFPVEEFDEVVRVNLRSAFLLTKHFLREFSAAGRGPGRERGGGNGRGGNLVHLVSAAARHPSRGKGPYAVAKAGVARLVQQAAVEGAPLGVRVNGVSPCYVFTPRHERELAQKAASRGVPVEELVEEVLETQLLRKRMEPGHLVPAVRLLLETEVMTGQVVNVAMGQVLN